jgi:hypothetical protein
MTNLHKCPALLQLPRKLLLAALLGCLHLVASNSSTSSTSACYSHNIRQSTTSRSSSSGSSPQPAEGGLPGEGIFTFEQLSAAASGSGAVAVAVSELEEAVAAVRQALGSDTSSISALRCLRTYLQRLGCQEERSPHVSVLILAEGCCVWGCCRLGGAPLLQLGGVSVAILASYGIC